MTTESLTTRILIEIRDSINQTREELGARLDETNVRLDETNVRLDETNVRLDETMRHESNQSATRARSVM